MASVVKIKRSSVQGKAPTTSDITAGEIALNTRDGKLFSSDGTAVFEVGANLHSLSVGTGGLTIGNNAFTLPTTDGTLNQIIKTNGSGVLSWTDLPVQPVQLDRDGYTTALHYVNAKLANGLDFGSITDTSDYDPFTVSDSNIPIYELMEPLGRTSTIDAGTIV